MPVDPAYIQNKHVASVYPRGKRKEGNTVHKRKKTSKDIALGHPQSSDTKCTKNGPWE